MSIDNLGQTGPRNLPEDLKAEIENARNGMTGMQIETTRLQKIALSTKGDIERMYEEKASLEKSISELPAKLEEAVKAVADKKFELTTLESQAENAKKTLKEATDSTGSIAALHTAKSAELDLREATIKSREEDMNNRNIALIKSETDHAAKVEKLRKAITE